MKKFRNAAVGLVVIGFTLVLTLCTYYNINMGKVSKDSTPKEVTIKAGSINSIATTLKENHLIKNKTIFNPGSVGMPIEMLNDNINDKTNKFSTVSSYMILEGNLNSKELGAFSINLVRLPYDIEKEVKLLEASNLPSKERLIKELKSATNCH